MKNDSIIKKTIKMYFPTKSISHTEIIHTDILYTTIVENTKNSNITDSDMRRYLETSYCKVNCYIY